MASGTKIVARRPKPERVGYLISSANTEDILPDPSPGQVIERDVEPPWFVVDHTLDRLIAGSAWPVRLWRAKVLKAIDPQDHHGHYTRATAIEILHELPLYKLFGDTDCGLVDLVEIARGLDLATADDLMREMHPRASAVYGTGWQRWLGHDDFHRGPEDHSATIAVTEGAPVRQIFTVIHTRVFERAGEISGDAAYGLDDENCPFLIEPWNSASAVLRHAAMAKGAPGLFDVQERTSLLRSYEHVFSGQA